MLCVTLKNYERTCSNVNGGISQIFIFDPNDFNFTQAAASGGILPGYSAATLRTGATGAGAVMFSVVFQENEAEWTWKQSVKGCSVKYDIELRFQLAENSQSLTNFLEAMDAASCCCGLGAIIRMNNQKIFVLGEKYVNTSETIRIKFKQDGSEGGSGKLLDDFNGGNIILKGSAGRNLYEFTGAWSAIEAFLTPAA